MTHILKPNSKIEKSVDIVRPPVDIYENGNEIVLEAELPGITKDSLNLEMTGNILSIHAKKIKDDIIEEKYTPLYRERHAAVEYRRDFEIDSEVDRQNIKANFDNGVLRIVLSKSTGTQPRKIEVISSN